MVRHRILLVEDDPDRVTLTRHALQDHDLDVEVDTARTSQEAIDHLSGTGASGPPDLVLLDLKLDSSSGLDVLEHLRGDERNRVLPVVVLTSSREASDRRASYELGANSYVCKPVDYEAFREKLHSIGTYWLSVDEGPGEDTGGPGR